MLLGAIFWGAEGPDASVQQAALRTVYAACTLFLEMHPRSLLSEGGLWRWGRGEGHCCVSGTWLGPACVVCAHLSVTGRICLDCK